MEQKKIKQFELGNGDIFMAEILDNHVSINMQTRNYGNQPYTIISASAKLKKSEAIELINWIGEKLIND